MVSVWVGWTGRVSVAFGGDGLVGVIVEACGSRGGRVGLASGGWSVGRGVGEGCWDKSTVG